MESLDDMILLAEVAEAGSFTQGGLRLGLPKSTVSQRIAQLEARLGLQASEPLDAAGHADHGGAVYLDYCRRVREEAKAATAAMGHLKVRPEGSLRITCPEITASHFMPGFYGISQGRIPRSPSIKSRPTRKPCRGADRLAFRVGPARRGDDPAADFGNPAACWSQPPPICRPHHIDGPGRSWMYRCLIHDTQPEWILTAHAGELPASSRPCVRTPWGSSCNRPFSGPGSPSCPPTICQPALTSGALFAPARLDPGTYEMVMIFSRVHPAHSWRFEIAEGIPTFSRPVGRWRGAGSR